MLIVLEREDSKVKNVEREGVGKRSENDFQDEVRIQEKGAPSFIKYPATFVKREVDICTKQRFLQPLKTVSLWRRPSQPNRSAFVFLEK